MQASRHVDLCNAFHKSRSLTEYSRTRQTARHLCPRPTHSAILKNGQKSFAAGHCAPRVASTLTPTPFPAINARLATAHSGLQSITFPKPSGLPASPPLLFLSPSSLLALQHSIPLHANLSAGIRILRTCMPHHSRDTDAKPNLTTPAAFYLPACHVRAQHRTRAWPAKNAARNPPRA